MIERTLSIIKPDALAKGHAGEILARFEKAGLKIVACRMLWLSRPEAREFYAVHKDRPFFKSLVEFMVSGPVIVSVLQGDNAIARHREILGVTDPSKAAGGSVRRDFGESIERNATHGSDAPDTAKFEIGHFFGGLDIFAYERA
jgi:nucleoside-diphosphate kinase